VKKISKITGIFIDSYNLIKYFEGIFISLFLQEALHFLKKNGFKIVTTTSDYNKGAESGISIDNYKPSNKTVLVLGNYLSSSW